MKNGFEKIVLILSMFISFFTTIHGYLHIALHEVGPLYGFGQSILPKGTAIARITPYYYKDSDGTFTYMYQKLYYGVTEDFTASINLPVVLKDKWGKHERIRAALQLQGEYAYILKRNDEESTLATLLANVLIPFPFTETENHMTRGAPSYFVGTAASHLTHDWYAYGAAGIRFNTRHRSTNFGNQQYIEWIFGHAGIDIGPIPTFILWEFNWLNYQHDYENNRKNINSGGNVLYCGPVILFSGERVRVLTGIQGVLTQKFNGNQPSRRYRASILVAYTF